MRGAAGWPRGLPAFPLSMGRKAGFPRPRTLEQRRFGAAKWQNPQGGRETDGPALAIEAIAVPGG